jgi:hypothetical protein
MSVFSHRSVVSVPRVLPRAFLLQEKASPLKETNGDCILQERDSHIATQSARTLRVRGARISIVAF